MSIEHSGGTMPEARELRESAVWFVAAAKNAADPRLKAPMLARARELNRRAKALAALESRSRSGVDRDKAAEGPAAYASPFRRQRLT